MYPWYRDTQIGVGQFCSPVSASIKTETGYNDCMLALDYAASQGSQSKVSSTNHSLQLYFFLKFSGSFSKEKNVSKKKSAKNCEFLCVKIVLLANFRSWWKFEFRWNINKSPKNLPLHKTTKECVKFVKKIFVKVYREKNISHAKQMETNCRKKQSSIGHGTCSDLCCAR